MALDSASTAFCSKDVAQERKTVAFFSLVDHYLLVCVKLCEAFSIHIIE
jgi:hypothetical protein